MRRSAEGVAVCAFAAETPKDRTRRQQRLKYNGDLIRLVLENTDPQCLQPGHALEGFQLELFEVPRQDALLLQRFYMAEVGFGVLLPIINDCHLTRLGKPFPGIPDTDLVDALFDDLVPDVVSAFDVEPFLVVAETDVYRPAIDKDQLGGIQGTLHPGQERPGEPVNGDHRPELPEPRLFQVARVEGPARDNGLAHVKVELDAVRPEFFKIAGIDLL